MRRILGQSPIERLGGLMHRYGYLKSTICLGAVSLACQASVRAEGADSATPLRGEPVRRRLQCRQSTRDRPEKNHLVWAGCLYISLVLPPVRLSACPSVSCAASCGKKNRAYRVCVATARTKWPLYRPAPSWLPFSAFLGAGEAPVMGPVNSLRHYDKPFSKEQFSLGPIGDSSRDPG